MGDMFKLLSAGAKFDFKRFKSDAVKTRLIRNPAHLAAEEPEAFLNSLEKLTESEESKSKARSEQNAASKERDADGGVVLLGNMRSGNAASIAAVKRKKGGAKVKDEAKLAHMAEEKINEFRNKHKMRVFGTDVPYPVVTFDHLQSRLGVSERLVENLKSSGYKAPTPVQMQAIPAMVSGRDVLVCAPTGSGKTAAFLVPVFHSLKEPQSVGFRAIILAPTHELANQMFHEACRIGQGLNFRVYTMEKAAPILSQSRTYKKFDVLVTTPKKLVTLLNDGKVSLAKVEWLVVDESDKLFETGKDGFRSQLATIYKACTAPSVRRALFSATFDFDVEEWCRVNLNNPLSVHVGIRNTGCPDVDQKLVYCSSEGGKLMYLSDLMGRGLRPPALVFVQSKERAKQLHRELSGKGPADVSSIHADITRKHRDEIVRRFRVGEIWVLICTELMGRGMDFVGVNQVINYDCPTSTVAYIHQVGRTGRAGRSGQALTFITEADREYVRGIAWVIRQSGGDVPEYLVGKPRPDSRTRKRLSHSQPERASIRSAHYNPIKRSKKKKKVEEEDNSGSEESAAENDDDGGHPHKKKAKVAPQKTGTTKKSKQPNSKQNGKTKERSGSAGGRGRKGGKTNGN